MVAAHILVADDEPQILTMVSEILKSRGYTYDLATDGLQALDFARKRRPDLLVTDVMMPGMTGWELASRLRTRQPDLRVVFMSGFTGDSTAVEPVREHELLRKPFSPATLVSKVRAALGHTAS